MSAWIRRPSSVTTTALPRATAIRRRLQYSRLSRAVMRCCGVASARPRPVSTSTAWSMSYTARSPVAVSVAVAMRTLPSASRRQISLPPESGVSPGAAGRAGCAAAPGR